MPLAARAWWQIAAVTAAAAGIYGGIRQLAGSGSTLTHHDFRASGRFAPEFCEPGAPAFIPFERVRGAVAATLEPARLSELVPTTLHLRLETASGRPVTPADIVESHTRLMHVLAVDPQLEDYQHLHPEPVVGKPGTWECTFMPRRAGTYRLFLDFTPRATGRGLYGLVELPVGYDSETGTYALPEVESLVYEADGVRFELDTGPDGLREGRRHSLKLLVRDPRGLVLQPVMGAWAHLVAFDFGRSGVAHVHAGDGVVRWGAEPTSCVLGFEIAFPQAGWCRIWAQLHVAGAERIIPFTLRVKPRL